MNNYDQGAFYGCILPLAALLVVVIGFLLHMGWDLYDAM